MKIPFRPLPVAIEQVAVRNGKYSFASIRTNVSPEFQEKLWEEVKDAWTRSSAGDIKDPLPDKRTCYNYNTRCEVADRCEAFQEWEKNPLKDLVS